MNKPSCCSRGFFLVSRGAALHGEGKYGGLGYCCGCARPGKVMSDGKKPGLLHFLQRLFGLGGDKPKPDPPPLPAKENRSSYAPKRKAPDKGSVKKESPSDKPAKKGPPSRGKPAKKVAAKPKPKAPPPAAPAEAPREVPPHERPAGDRQETSSEEKAAPSVYTPATPEKPEGKTEPGAKPAGRMLDLQRLQARSRPRTKAEHAASERERRRCRYAPG
jgi:hypothetical protein